MNPTTQSAVPTATGAAFASGAAVPIGARAAVPFDARAAGAIDVRAAAPAAVRSGVPAAILVAALALGACGGDDGTTLGRFDVDEEIPATRVAGGGIGALLPGALAPFALDVRSESEYAAEEFSFVNSIEIDEVTLVIDPASEDAARDALENGMPDDFDFLDALTLSIEAEIDGETRRAVVAAVPAGDPRLSGGNRTLPLDTTSVNVLPFVEAAGGYRLVSEASGSPPPDDVVFGGTVGYRVSVGFR